MDHTENPLNFLSFNNQNLVELNKLISDQKDQQERLHHQVEDSLSQETPLQRVLSSKSNEEKRFLSNENLENLLSGQISNQNGNLKRQQVAGKGKNSSQIFPIDMESSQQVIGQEFQRQNQVKSSFTRNLTQLTKNSQLTNSSQNKSMTTIPEKRTLFNLQLIVQLKMKMRYFFKMFTFSGRRLLLESNQKVRMAINDKSDLGEQPISKFKGRFKKFFNLTEDDIENLKLRSGDTYMITPSSYFNNFLLFAFTIFNFIFLLYLTIVIVFQSAQEYEPLLDKIVLVVWGFEMLIQLNTQIYHKNSLINNRRIVILLYLKKRAILDVIPIITVFMASPTQRYFHLVMQFLTLLKARNLLLDIGLVQKFLCMTVKNYYIVQLFNLIVKIFLFGHAIACMWYIVGQIELNLLRAETTWYYDSFGADGVWWKLYLESVYWALTLMTAGSNEAHSLIQLFFTTFIMLFTAIIFGYMLNTTGTILSQLNQEDDNKRIDLNIINDYMRTNKISARLQSKVNSDLEYYYINNLKKEQEENQEVLRKISPHLNRLLKLEYGKQFLEKISFMEKQFSRETLDEVSLVLEEEYYPPNQWLFKENQHQDISLIFIVQGSAQLLKQSSSDDKDQKLITYAHKGKILGSVNFFTGLSYHFGAKSSEFTKVIKINRERFLEILSKNEKDKEIFSSMKDKQAIYEEYGVSDSKCYFCNCFSHLPTECHLVHVEKAEILQKAKIFVNTVQERYEYSRNSKKQVHSLKNLKQLQLDVDHFKVQERRERKILKKKQQRQQLQELDAMYTLENDGHFSKSFDLEETLEDESEHSFSSSTQQQYQQQQQQQNNMPPINLFGRSIVKEQSTNQNQYQQIKSEYNKLHSEIIKIANGFGNENISPHITSKNIYSTPGKNITQTLERNSPLTKKEYINTSKEKQGPIIEHLNSTKQSKHKEINHESQQILIGQPPPLENQQLVNLYQISDQVDQLKLQLKQKLQNKINLMHQNT